MGDEDFDSFDGETVYGTPQNDTTFVPGLVIFVEASEMSDPASLAFEYEILDFSDTNLKFKLHFVNPPSVSSTTEKDVMVI